MKTTAFLAATLLTLGLSTAAFAQTPATTPAPTPPSNDTNPMTPSNNQPQVGTTPDGASIANNRDRLSPGTGTPASQVATPAERQARRDAKRAQKGKSKSKDM